MSLPETIELLPLPVPVRAEITVPGSKSITNRALVLAALSEGETTLRGALWSEDTQVMVECLQELGFMVNVSSDPTEPCNRTITVYGLAGQVPRGGTQEQPLELFVGNAGTAARFLAAMVCLGGGVYRLHGVARMHDRPQAALFQTLRELGYRIDSANDKLPALIHGAGPRSAPGRVSIEESSQFASALLLCARFGNWRIEVVGENEEESPYVAMTRQLVEVFPARGGTVQVEPDASSGSYFWAAGWLTLGAARDQAIAPGDDEEARALPGGKELPLNLRFPTGITVANWPTTGWQIDSEFIHYLPLPGSISRKTELGDSIMTAIAIAPFAPLPVRFTDLGRLRVQECERVAALRDQLTQCGATVRELPGDVLEVRPSALHGATIETYQDHRMAMCFAILGLKVPGIQIKNPACVKKTFPNFFQKLAGPPPGGLGATILDAGTRQPLSHGNLFAD